ncbi:MAG: ABC transporter permease [Thermodesulfobacteriota bacterium]
MENWIGKQKHVIDFTLSSIFRKKGKNGALVAVYTLIVFLLASAVFFTHSIKKEAAFVLRDSPEMLVQRMSGGRHDLIPASYIDSIRRIRGVHAVKGRLWGYYYDPVVGANYTLLVPGDGTGGPERISIGKGISKSRLAFEGDSLSFRAYNGAVLNLEIQEILSSDSELVSSDLILMAEKDFRKLFGISKGYFTDLTVSVRNKKELTTIATKILQLLPDSRPILRDEILRTYDSVFDWRGGILIVILLGSVMAFIIFAWDKAAGLSAEEKREIGILKALGWETSDVLLMKFWEGVAVSLTSFLLGILLAYGHIFFTSAAVFSPVLKGWSVLYPDFRLTPFISAYQVGTLFFLTVIPYTVSTIVPSWRAATIDPDSIMRS